MKISTNNFQEIIDDPKINADLLVIEGTVEKNYKISIEIRGSSSKSFPKNHMVLKQKLLIGLKILMLILEVFPKKKIGF